MWNNIVLTDVQVQSLVQAQRVKWEVPTLTTPLVVSSSSSIIIPTKPATQVLLNVSNLASIANLPLGLPTPKCWLDAACPDTLFSDTSGIVYTMPNGRVQQWNDRSGHRCHCTFSTAVWMTGPQDTVNNLPVVMTGSSLGIFPTTGDRPLTGTLTTGFTVLAIKLSWVFACR